MPTFGSWIKRTVQQVLDPDREARVQEVATLLNRDLQKSRDKFSLRDFFDRVPCSEHDLECAKRIVYKKVLDRAWQDGKISPEEHKVLNWVVKCLEIPSKEAEDVKFQIARDRFASALAQAMDDGLIDHHEATQLSAIAQSVGYSLGDFVGHYFQSEGEAFLRCVFAACVEDGLLAEKAWSDLLETTTRLGISRDALSNAIASQAERFIEHVIADAKSDGDFSEAEEKQLLDLVQLLGIPQSSRSYVDRAVSSLRVIRKAREGKLPIIDRPVGVAIRAGEIVHLHQAATWYQRRVLKSGQHMDEHNGTLTITDNRLLFSSNTKSFDVRFGKIVAHSGKTGVLSVQRMEKPESIICVAENEPIAYAILEGAIALANQTRLSKEYDMPSRFIPREVRQRVWQRYGGQ